MKNAPKWATPEKRKKIKKVFLNTRKVKKVKTLVADLDKFFNKKRGNR